MKTLRLLAAAVPAVLLAVFVDAALRTFGGELRIFDPYLVAVVAFASRGRKVDALLVGALAGLAQDSLGSVVVGVHFLSKVIVAYAIGLTAGRLLSGQVVTRAILLGGGTLLEVVVLRGLGFILGQSLDVRSFGALFACVALNVVLGSAALSAATSLVAGRRRPGGYRAA